MANDYFQFKQFLIYQDRCAFKVGTDGVLLGALADVTGATRILDIGAGTGLIAIMLAQRSNASIVAIETDESSFIQMTENITKCKWSDRITPLKTDFQSFSSEHTGTFDLIVTNPPYFTNSLRNPDPRKSMARHNDSLSSDEILLGVSRLLDEKGIFQLILPYVDGNLFIANAVRYGFYCTGILKIKPLPTLEVSRMILTFGRDWKKRVERFLTIEHGKRHSFTEDYIRLTKDFYLKF